MATSPDLELRLGSLSIEEDGSPEAAKTPLQAEDLNGTHKIDLNEAPASTPVKAAPSQEPRVGLVYSEQMMLHAHPKEDHPEQPARISSIFSELKRQKLIWRMIRVPARNATDEELATVHTKDHVTLMKDISKRTYGAQGRAAVAAKYNSIYFNEGSTVSSLLAAGSVVEVAVQVAQGKLDRAAAVVRPPGHHAEAGKPMGFCLYNNVAVAAHWLVHKLKLVKRVLIVDWDVHHGNGTQHMFYEDPSVLYFSPHRFDFGSFYPCSPDGNLDMVGSGAGEGFNVNVPWPWEGFGDADYLAAWDRVLLPIARQFDPDIVLISAGFDAAKGDPLGECEITPYGYSHLTHKLLELAGGKLVLALEGGYNLDAISKSYAACTSVLLGEPPLDAPPEDTPLKLQSCTLELLDQVREALAPYWVALRPEVPIVIESVEILAVTEVTEVPVGAPELICPTLVLSPSESNLAAEDVPPVEDLEPSSPQSAAYEEESEVIVVELERTTFSAESAESSSATETAAKAMGGESDPRDRRIAELESEVRRLKELNLKLESDREGHGAAAGGGVQRVPVDGPESAGASSSGEGHRLDTSRFGFRVMQPREDGSGATGSGGFPDGQKTHVWYASFGSNLWEERFLCYIKGGKLDIMGTACAGTTDPTPPTAKTTFLVPRRLFFGHKSTARWGDGGVAFLLPYNVPGAESTAILRAYRITLEQFNQVVAQENRILPTDVATPFITAADLPPLRSGQSSPPGLASLQDRWYGNILYLGDHDAEPVLTFTCSEAYAGDFFNGAFETRPPSDTYKQALVNGLVSAGLTRQEAELYVDVRGSVPLTKGTG